MDGGANWTRMTGPDVIINDVYVDPKNTQHVMLATDRSGVLTSRWTRVQRFAQQTAAFFSGR